MAASGGYAAQRRAYKGAHRGEGDEEAEEEKFQIPQRKIEKYLRLVNKNTEFFSSNEPEELLEMFMKYLEKSGAKFEVAKDKFKVKAQVENGEGGEMVKIKM